MANVYGTMIDRLVNELKKDIIFFGICGFVTGCLLLLHNRLKEVGVAEGEPWAIQLLSDFVSFNAMFLIAGGVTIVGAVATLIQSLAREISWLKDVVKHSAERLTQIASSIIAFTFGLFILGLLHSVIAGTFEGLKLALLIIFVDCLVLTLFVFGSLSAYRIAPFDKVQGALSLLFLAVFIMSALLIFGAN